MVEDVEEQKTFRTRFEAVCDVRARNDIDAKNKIKKLVGDSPDIDLIYLEGKLFSK